MAERWNFFDKILKPVWVALPGDENQLGGIYAYDAIWHKVTSFEVHQNKLQRTISGVPDLPPIAPLLAFVYNPATPPELTCVLWNRTEAEVQVTGSRIIATNAALGYRRELALPASPELHVAVAPGTHTDWRLPWSTIIEQIPPADLARIKAADGKLDIVWQANDLSSPALPLLLGWQGNQE